MYCAYCGKEMTEGTPVCPGCGYETRGGSAPVAPPAEPTPAPVYAPPGLEGEHVPVYAPPIVKSPPKPAGAAPAPQGQPPAEGAGAFVPPPTQPYGGQVPPPPPYGAEPPQQGAPGWGVPAQAYPGAPAPAPGPDGQQDPEKKKKRTRRIAIVAAVVCLVVVGAAVAVFAFTRSNPAAVVLGALNNSRQQVSKEMAATRDQLGLGSYAAWENAPVKMDLDMGMEVPGYNASSSRVNVRMGFLMDLSQRRIDMDFGLGMSGANMLSGTLSLDDDVMSLALPDLYEGSYGVHTATLAEDFNKSNLRGMLDAEKMDPDTSFNYFDLLEARNKAAEKSGEGHILPTEVRGLLSELWKGSTVAGAGQRTEQVNGHDRACRVYTVTVPKAVARTFLKDLVLYLEENDDAASELTAALNQLYGTSVYSGYGTDNLIYYLEEVEMDLSGDVVVDVLVADNMAVALDGTLPLDEDVHVRMELGGEKNLSDAFLLEVEDERDTLLRVSAAGSHVMKDGVFSTDVKVQSYDYYEDELLDVLALTVKYDSSSALDNFEATARFVHPSYYNETMRVDVMGTVDVADDGISYDLYDITVESDDEMVEASLVLDMYPGDAADFKDAAPTMLLDMKLMELTELQEEIQLSYASLLIRWMALLY